MGALVTPNERLRTCLWALLFPCVLLAAALAALFFVVPAGFGGDEKTDPSPKPLAVPNKTSVLKAASRTTETEEGKQKDASTPAVSPPQKGPPDIPRRKTENRKRRREDNHRRRKEDDHASAFTGGDFAIGGIG